MRRWITIGATTVGAVALGSAGAVAIGTWRWERATRRAVRRLTARLPARGDAATPATYSPERLEGLPAPAARYLRFALTPGQPLVRRACIRWAGEFRTRPDAAWSPFTAVQHYTADPPGFVWDAEIRMIPRMPLLPMRVRDAYVAGEGAMLGRLAALVPVVRQGGTPAMAAGSLMRYLAESVWLPTALLPSDGVRWTPVDDATARVTLTDRATTVAVDMHFGARGEIERVSALRERDVDGTPVPTPWVGEFRDYERMEGMMVPRGGEVAWLLGEDDGEEPFAYWRGDVVGARYQFGG